MNLRCTNAFRPVLAVSAVAASLGLALLAALPARAFDFGPPDGFAGNPPDAMNCTLCHYEFEVNSGDGALQLIGLPATYVPGQTYNLSVRLSDPEQKRWGFELTVQDDADYNEQGGQLVVLDDVNTQLSPDGFGTGDFLKHTKIGTFEGTSDGPVEWSFAWTAPDASVASVTFYAAGNAANGDDSYTGDYVYTTSQTAIAESPTAARLSSWGRVKGLYRR